jgi:hypothetical protein
MIKEPLDLLSRVFLCLILFFWLDLNLIHSFNYSELAHKIIAFEAILIYFKKLNPMDHKN